MNKLFARQLAKATTPSGKVDLDELGELVGSAYDQADRDHRRTDRSISLMIEELDTLGKEIFNLRFQRASGQLENTARVRQVRRDIARIKTILGERQRQAPVAG